MHRKTTIKEEALMRWSITTASQDNPRLGSAGIVGVKLGIAGVYRMCRLKT